MRGRRWLPALLLLGCTARPPPGSDAWLIAEGRRFIERTDARRTALEASLTNHDNQYSKLRLGAYALEHRGWDLLPEWNPRSRPVTASIAASLERGVIPDRDAEPLWDGRTPSTAAEWVALGERVFFGYPMRAEVFLEHGMTRRALVDAVGIERTASGDTPGLVVFRDVDGAHRVGITCAICHASVKAGATVAGHARRSFDYGRLRLAYFEATGEPLDPGLKRRMESWGPGRADVTEDDDEDPVAIPDLWGLRAQSFLTQAGTIRHDSPLALAIRQETQLTDSNHQRVRPPRVLVWALVMYLYALEPPARAASAPSIAGKKLFAAHCASCHDNAAHGGQPIAAAKIGTDPALANGRGRGTGRYRPAPLVRVSEGAPYLHDGAVTSLVELLSPGRFAPDYRGGRWRPGPIPGHRAGTELSAGDRADLIAFLETF